MTSSPSGVFVCASDGSGRSDQSSVQADYLELPALAGDDLAESPDAAPFFAAGFLDEERAP